MNNTPLQTVEPQNLRANGLWNVFTNRKKWTVSCGNCGHSWQEKVLIVERCSAICPCCRTQNVWSAQAWQEYYNRILEASKIEYAADKIMGNKK